jgi:hypothetical protein
MVLEISLSYGTEKLQFSASMHVLSQLLLGVCNCTGYSIDETHSFQPAVSSVFQLFANVTTDVVIALSSITLTLHMLSSFRMLLALLSVSVLMLSI